MGAVSFWEKLSCTLWAAVGIGSGAAGGGGRLNKSAMVFRPGVLPTAGCHEDGGAAAAGCGGPGALE